MSRDKLDRLADALVENILSTSDEEILREVQQDAENGGTGWTRINPDGSLERIAPEDIYLPTDQS